MDSEFYTATLAKVYAQQGHLGQAAEIYRFLLAREPERRELAEALSKIEAEIDAVGHKTAADLVPLFQKWIRLLLKYRRLNQLKTYRRILSS